MPDFHPAALAIGVSSCEFGVSISVESRRSKKRAGGNLLPPAKSTQSSEEDALLCV